MKDNRSWLLRKKRLERRFFPVLVFEFEVGSHVADVNFGLRVLSDARRHSARQCNERDACPGYPGRAAASSTQHGGLPVSSRG